MLVYSYGVLEPVLLVSLTVSTKLSLFAIAPPFLLVISLLCIIGHQAGALHPSG
jgi:hypothetical protein